MNEQELASEAIELQTQIKELGERLDHTKAQLREVADGQKMEIRVPGKGIVNVTTPRDSSEKYELKINEDKLNTAPELKKKLIDKDIIYENFKTIPGASASVRIQVNV